MTSLPPWRPAPASTTRRCNARLASVFDPRNVRESAGVAGDGVGIGGHLQAPPAGDRSVMVPVRGLVITHDDHESHPNRTNPTRRRAQNSRLAERSAPLKARRIAPNRTKTGRVGGAVRRPPPPLTSQLTRERVTRIELAFSAWESHHTVRWLRACGLRVRWQRCGSRLDGCDRW